MTRRTYVHPDWIEPLSRCGYPEPYKSRCMPREKRALGDAMGLTKIGVNLTVLQPGKESSMRHWHTHEDELVYVLEGELVLVTDTGEQILRAGMCAGFPAGEQVGHQLINRSTAPAKYLEISNREEGDGAEYTEPGVDIAYRDGKMVRKDGSAI